MSWLEKLLAFFGFGKRSSSQEVVHVLELRDWVDEQYQEHLSKTHMNQHTINFANQVKQKRWVIECYLDDWEKAIPLHEREVKEIFSKTRKALDVIEFPDPSDVDDVMETATSIVEALDDLTAQIDNSSFGHEYSFLLSENNREKTPINPLLKEIVEIQAFCQKFDHLKLKANIHKFNTLFQKSEIIEQKTQLLRENFQKYKRKKHRYKSVVDQHNNKKDSLEYLEESPQYQRYKQVRSKRSEYQEELQTVIHAHRKLELQKAIDDLEKPFEKQFLLKMDEIDYRLDHFQKQKDRFKRELKEKIEQMEEIKSLRDQEVRLFVNLAKSILSRKISVKLSSS